MAAKSGGMAKGSRKRNLTAGLKGMSVRTTMNAMIVPKIVAKKVEAPATIRLFLTAAKLSARLKTSR
jgi:hypothetical protein